VRRVRDEDSPEVTRKYAEIVQQAGGVALTGTKVVGIVRRDGGVVVETTHGDYKAGFLVNCAGLYSDRVGRMAGAEPDVRIVPFRSE
jgi:(S)-2-hydroxyglutarate dehydrogenase